MRRAYVTVEEAIRLPGVRIAFTQGVPGPWGEAVRAIYDIKAIDYTPVIQEGAQPNAALLAWTGQNSAPCVMFNDERPRAHWSEMLMLGEQLSPQPRLVPSDEGERTDMFGIAHQLCGEDGFGWCGRLVQFDILLRAKTDLPIEGMLRKFTSGVSRDHAKTRMISIMEWLSRRVEQQAQLGSPYFVGRNLSAADIYWTTFSNMVAPMEQNICPMPDHYREMCEKCIESVGVEVPSLLVRHRDNILKNHFILPMWF